MPIGALPKNVNQYGRYLKKIEMGITYKWQKVRCLKPSIWVSPQKLS